MSLELLVLSALVVLPVAGISFVALRRAWEPKERVAQRLNRPGPELLPESSAELFLGELTLPLAGLFPATQNYRAQLHQDLRTAGYYQSSALTHYLALRNLLV